MEITKFDVTPHGGSFVLRVEGVSIKLRVVYRWSRRGEIEEYRPHIAASGVSLSADALEICRNLIEDKLQEAGFENAQIFDEEKILRRPYNADFPIPREIVWKRRQPTGGR